MRQHFVRAPSVCVAALLLGCAFARPADARLRLVAQNLDQAAVTAPADSADLALPDLPAAGVVITPTDLARSPAPAAEPAPPALADSPQAPVAPQPAVTVPLPEALGNPVSTRPVPDALRHTPLDDPDGDLKTGSVMPAPPTVAPARVEPSLAAPSAAAPPVPAEPAPALPAAAVSFDPQVLHRLLDAYVGSEPGPVAGRVPAQELARFKDRQAVAALYAARSFAPLWIEDGRFDAKARSALSRIDHAAEDGLDLRAILVAVPHGGDAEAQAASELSLTRAVVAYGQQASGGRVDPLAAGAADRR